MLQEVLNHLQLKPGACCVDGTLGGGGHAAAILKVIEPNGRLLGCDRDGDAIEACRQRFASWSDRVELHRGSYADLLEWVPRDWADGVLMDLGVSSHQLDRMERGFSFNEDGPLDMRMDQRLVETAADVVNYASQEELARVFREWGEERDANRLARLLVLERQTGEFRSTRQLASFIEKVSRAPKGKRHPATRVFQALRIRVNNELGELADGLEAAYHILKPGGRLAVITFHSLEARMVKEFGRKMTRDYTFEGEVDVPELRKAKEPEMVWVVRKAIPPSRFEIVENPRARSAQLRVLQKC